MLNLCFEIVFDFNIEDCQTRCSWFDYFIRDLMLLVCFKDWANFVMPMCISFKCLENIESFQTKPGFTQVKMILATLVWIQSLVKSANLSLCQRLNYSKLTRCCKKCLPIDNPAIFAFKTLFLWWLVCFCLLHYKQHLKHWAQSVIANKKASWGPRFKYETAGCEARMLPLC